MGGTQERRSLEHQAERLEAVLASHKVVAHVLGGTVTPRLVRFHLVPAHGTRIRSITHLAEELAMGLGVRSLRVHRRDGQIEVEIPRETPTTVRLKSILKHLGPVPAGTAVLGRDEDGMPLLLRLPSPDVAHVLICGTTGSGKTALARTMITSLALTQSVRDLGFVLVDPEGRGYQPFAGLPHLAREIATTHEETQSALEWLVTLMEHRDGARLSSPPVMCFIDELADLLMTSPGHIQSLVTRLTQRGRSAGIHLIACTQKPTATAIGSLAKSNFPVRLVGSVTSPEDAKVATGLKQSEAEKLLGRGDFLLVIKGQIRRFQAAYTSPADIRRAIEVLRGNHPWRMFTVKASEEEAGN